MKIENGIIYKLTPKDLMIALAMFINYKRPDSINSGDMGRIDFDEKEDGMHLTVTVKRRTDK